MNKKRKQMIILCGGKGKRMGKLTHSIPKPLIKVGKKTILEHKVNYYKTQKIHLNYPSELLMHKLIDSNPVRPPEIIL